MKNTENTKNIIDAKEAAKKITEAANGTQVVVTRTNVNPALFVGNFSAALHDLFADVENAIAVYNDAMALPAENAEKNMTIAKAWNDVVLSVDAYNKRYTALQLDAIRACGVSVYCASPFRRELKIKRDKGGNYQEMQYTDAPIYPAQVSTAETPLFASKEWKSIFRTLATHCGYMFASEMAFETREGKSSISKIKEALTDCIQAVFGAECKYQARSVDARAMLYSVASRDMKNCNSFRKLSEEKFAWCIIDTIGAAMYDCNYKFSK